MGFFIFPTHENQFEQFRPLICFPGRRWGTNWKENCFFWTSKANLFISDFVKTTLSDNFIGKLYVWDYQLLIIDRIRWEEDLSGLQRHQWDHGEAEKLMFYENPLWKKNIFISNSGNSMNRISFTLCNAQGYFYPRFEAIYSSQRHNWPPTLEIMPRNFPKSWHLQNFQNIQNFQFSP